MLERRELGEAGLAYIRERLADGGTLSRLLLNGLDLAAGHAWAYLPPAMTDEQAARFAQAGVTRRATGAPSEVFWRLNGRWTAVRNLVDPLIADRVLDFFTPEDLGVAVWEDPVTGAGDRWVRDHPEESLLFLGEEVYYVLRQLTASPAAIAGGLQAMGA